MFFFIFLTPWFHLKLEKYETSREFLSRLVTMAHALLKFSSLFTLVCFIFILNINNFMISFKKLTAGGQSSKKTNEPIVGLLGPKLKTNKTVHHILNVTLLYQINVQDGIKRAGWKIQPNLGLL